MNHKRAMILDELCEQLPYEEAINSAKNYEEAGYIRDCYGIPTIGIDGQKMGEMLREQAKLDSEPRVSGPEMYLDQLDKWDIIKEAKFTEVEYAHGDVHAWFEYETTLTGEKVLRRTHQHPAEYERDDVVCEMNISWDLDVHNNPEVYIEVRRQ